MFVNRCAIYQNHQAFQYVSHYIMSIGRGGSIRRCGKTDTMVCCVKYGIETLKECIAVDKVKALSAGRSEISDDKVDIVGRPSNIGIQCTGPKLRIRSKLVRHLRLYKPYMHQS